MSGQGKREKSRLTHARAVLGSGLQSRLADVKVLVVGAGGIGCELCFGNITLLDLDTIDLSNLNRQFLFRKKDIKQSKAIVASRTAHHFNPSVNITPIYGNIKDPQFDVSWFRGFDIVLNALDNLDARRHVNKMCLAASVPLVESGTAGYLGQVQPIVKDQTECFDCLPKPTPKTYPVCTIRSTPSQPIHCIVWAKNYLLPQLFGEAEDGDELDEAERAGENPNEIAALRQEAQAFSKVRKAIRNMDFTIPTENGKHQNGSWYAANSSDPAHLAFDKVFSSDIKTLLSMDDMWKNRTPPTPLDFEKIANGSFNLRSYNMPEPGPSKMRHDLKTGMTQSVMHNGTKDSTDLSGLKDQRQLSLQENLVLFVSSTHRLAARLRAGEETISFDKDDDDTLDFVTAASNLRSAAYGIHGKSRWELKEIAGNIIPAIATTNAIVAGIIVLQALQLLRKNYIGMRNVHLQRKPEVPLNACTAGQPSRECGVCRDTYVEVLCDPERVTLSEVVNGLLGDGHGNGTGPRDVSVYEDKRLLSDPDFDDNLDRTLSSLGVTRGKFLTIVDENEEWGTVAAAIGQLPSNHTKADPAVILPSPLPIPHRLTKQQSSPSRKHPLDDNEDDRPLKRMKVGGPPGNIDTKSPSKLRRLEEDGLLILDGTDEPDELEVIIIED